MGLQVSSVFALFTLAPFVNSITRPHRNVTLRGVGYAPRHSFHLFARSAAKLVFFLSINRSTAVIRRARSVRYFYATADRLGGGVGGGEGDPFPRREFRRWKFTGSPVRPCLDEVVAVNRVKFIYERSSCWRECVRVRFYFFLFFFLFFFS